LGVSLIVFTRATLC